MCATKGPDIKSFQKIGDLIDVIGNDAKIPYEMAKVSNTKGKLQLLKEEYLGISQESDLFKHLRFLLKELDPERNGYVSN